MPGASQSAFHSSLWQTFLSQEEVSLSLKTMRQPVLKNQDTQKKGFKKEMNAEAARGRILSITSGKASHMIKMTKISTMV